MSLFVGNIARDVNDRDLETEFDRISACEFKFKVSIIKTLKLDINHTLIIGKLCLR